MNILQIEILRHNHNGLYAVIVNGEVILDDQDEKGINELSIGRIIYLLERERKRRIESEKVAATNEHPSQPCTPKKHLTLEDMIKNISDSADAELSDTDEWIRKIAELLALGVTGDNGNGFGPN